MPMQYVWRFLFCMSGLLFGLKYSEYYAFSISFIYLSISLIAMSNFHLVFDFYIFEYI